MERFVDRVSIIVSSGNGGTGRVSFEKAKVRGLADGGDGGQGGNVYICPRRTINTLAHLNNGAEYKAGKGHSGSRDKKSGAHGEHLCIYVPVGTMVFHQDTGQLLFDCTEADADALVLQGGRGGKGNTHFKSSRMRTPRFSQDGEPGYTLQLDIELRMIADVVIVGEANAGKSSLLSALTNVSIPIAPYPYTTKVPMHAVWTHAYTRVHMVELPATEEQYLRHVWRASLIIYVIAADADVVATLEQYKNRITEMYPTLHDKQQPHEYVVLTKTDILDDEQQENKEGIIQAIRNLHVVPYCISLAPDSKDNDTLQVLQEALLSNLTS